MHAARTGRRLGAVTALVGLAIGAGAGQASASPVSVTIPFDCEVPIVGPVGVSVVFTADVPATSSSGAPFPIGALSAVIALPDIAFTWIRPFGAVATAGSFDSTIDVDSPAGNQFPITGAIGSTPLPDPQGPDLLVAATGIGPQATGPVTRVAAGTHETLHLYWYDANGGSVFADEQGNPVVLDTPCVATGDTTLGSIVVT